MEYRFYPLWDSFDIPEESYRLPYFRYEEIKKAVAEFLVRYGMAKVPVDAFALAKRMGRLGAMWC